MAEALKVGGSGAERAPCADRIVTPLHDLSAGGSERIAIRLANRWAALGRRPVLFCGVADGELAGLVGPGVDVVGCAPAIPRGPGSRRRLGRALAERLAQAPSDLLFAPGNYHWPLIPAVARRLGADRPAIVAQLSNPLRRPGRSAPAQIAFDALTRRRLRAADAAVSLSDAATAEADRVLGRRITRRIPLPALDDDRAPPRRPPLVGAPLILCAGRLAPQKGFDVALRAFACAELSESRLVILGEGPERAALQRLVAELGLSGRVDLPGHVADIRPWLDRCRLLLLTSRFEGYGAVIVEALAAGRPVVATACTPAAGELLAAPGCGRVAPVGDVEAVARAITEVLVQAAPDPCTLAARVQGFSMGPAARAYLELFDAACAGRAGPGAAR